MAHQSSARLSVALAAALWAAAGMSHPGLAQTAPSAPTDIPNIKFARGQSVVPYLEGWIKNPDGSYDFVFGYYNRNTEQELVIPPGPNNSVVFSGAPADDPDHGQPSFFLPRKQSRVFRVRVPKDWTPTRTVTWTLVANGKTEKVVSRLTPHAEINERMMISGGNGGTFGEPDLNQPPKLELPSLDAVAVGSVVALDTVFTDDGLPRMAPPRASRPVSPESPNSRFQSQTNSANPRPQPRPRVTWMQYRGPAKATFKNNPGEVVNGKATSTVTFDAPGTYTLLAFATDGRLTTRYEMTLSVK